MKSKVITIAACLFMTLTAGAKNIKSVVLKSEPEMVFANCENRIKSNIRFEKGIKEIVTDLKNKTVTVKYDDDKTNVDNIIIGFSRIDYKASVVKDTTEEKGK